MGLGGLMAFNSTILLQTHVEDEVGFPTRLVCCSGTMTGSRIIKLKAMRLGTHVELEDKVRFPTRLVCWHRDWKQNRQIEGHELQDSCGT